MTEQIKSPLIYKGTDYHLIDEEVIERLDENGNTQIIIIKYMEKKEVTNLVLKSTIEERNNLRND